MKKISDKFHQGALTITTFLVIFAAIVFSVVFCTDDTDGHGLKLEKARQAFSSLFVVLCKTTILYLYSFYSYSCLGHLLG